MRARRRELSTDFLFARGSFEGLQGIAKCLFPYLRVNSAIVCSFGRHGGTPAARCRSNGRFRTMASRGQRSSVVEQLFRKQQVFGSNPNVGSTFLYTKRALDEVLADRAFAKTHHFPTIGEGNSRISRLS